MGLAVPALWPFVSGGAALILSALVVAVFRHALDVSGAIMIMLVPVLWTAARHGRTPAIAVSVAAAAVSNFFFFDPFFAFGFQTIQDAIRLAVFLLVALTTGSLAARLKNESDRHRLQAEIAHQRSEDLRALFALSQAANSAESPQDLVAKVETELHNLLGVAVTIHTDPLPRQPTDRGVVPLVTPQGDVGALKLDVDVSPWPLPAPRDRVLRVAADMVVTALEKARLRNEMEDARVQAETERLRAALLSSVSHDFRTPLGSIMGAASSLLSNDAAYSAGARRQMLTTVLQSAERLDCYVRNILDLTVIEAGQIVSHRDWAELEDLVGSALGAVEENLGHRPVSVSIEHDLPLLWVDFVQMERVLVNLLENAAKFSGPECRIEIAARRDGNQILVEVFNSGSVLPSDERADHLFERFQRGGSEVTGTGLGLAICRGFMRAHGGEISARTDVERGGVTFRLSLPLRIDPPAIKENEE